MANEQKIFIDFFPRPPEPNPFTFNSWEDYEKAMKALHEVGYARDEWENKIFSKKEEIKDSDILHWKSLLNIYETTLNDGLQDRFKQTQE